MAESSHTLLKRALLAHYPELREQLARRLGEELAAEALHEVWLRLDAKHGLPTIDNPERYLFKAAINTAKNLRRSATARQRLVPIDIAELTKIPDDSPDPEKIAAARLRVDALRAALAELPLRQQAVFQETFLGDATQPEMAKQHNVTVRTIQNDLYHAMEHCMRRLRKKKIGFVNDRRAVSSKREGSS